MKWLLLAAAALWGGCVCITLETSKILCDPLSPDCPPGMSCVAGVCRPESLAWTMPANGSITPSALLEITLTSASPPNTLSYTATGPFTTTGELSGVGGKYSGLFSGTDGEWTIEATHGGSSAAVKFTLDRTAPKVTIAVAAAAFADLTPGVKRADPFLPGRNAWKRDESVEVAVHSDEPFGGIPVLQIAGLRRDGGWSAFSAAGIGLDGGCCADAGVCACFRVDLSAPVFEAFNGTLPLQASARDRVGNTGSADAGVLLTRWRWASSVFEPSTFPVEPAIDVDGNLIAGASQLTSVPISGSLASVDPRGVVKWRRDGGPISAAVAIGSSKLIYVPVGEGFGSAVLNYQADGTPVTGGCPLMPNSRIDTAVTISQLPLEQVTIFRTSGDAGSFFGHRALDVINPCLTAAAIAIPPSQLWGDSALISFTAPAPVFAYGGGSSGTEVGLRSQGALAPTFGPVNVGVVPKTLGVSGAGDLVGTGAGAGLFRAFRIGLGFSSDWYWEGLGPVGHLAVGPSDVLYFGSGTGAASALNRIAIGADAGTAILLTGEVSTAPVIGRDGTIYVGTQNGVVQALDQQLNPLWQMPMAQPATGFFVSPTLDCARNALGVAKSGPGTLYLHGTFTGTIYALIVDSHGLSIDAPWPKFQRDVRNSGDRDSKDVACPE